MLSIGGQIRFPTMGMAGQICPNNWCNCYKKPGHGKDRCLKLHGKLPNFGKNRKSKGGQQGNQEYTHLFATQPSDESSQDTREFNKEEIEKLGSLLGTLAKPLGACSLALAGKSLISHVLSASNINFPNSWVIDSGATNHMTNSSLKFSIYSPYPSNIKITTADGSLTTVVDQGEIKIHPFLALKNVLHVPKLSTNLVSIRKLIQNMNCSVIFHLTLCFSGLGLGEDDVTC